MTAGSAGDPTRVLVVSSDARVTTALAAAVGAMPDTVASSAVGTPCDVEAALDAVRPHVAVVDVARADTARDLQMVRRLARRVPVVAVSDTRGLCARAVDAGATCLCDKDGEMTTLTAAVTAAAASRRATPRTGVSCDEKRVSAPSTPS